MANGNMNNFDSNMNDLSNPQSFAESIFNDDDDRLNNIPVTGYELDLNDDAIHKAVSDALDAKKYEKQKEDLIRNIEHHTRKKWEDLISIKSTPKRNKILNNIPKVLRKDAKVLVRDSRRSRLNCLNSRNRRRRYAQLLDKSSKLFNECKELKTFTGETLKIHRDSTPRQCFQEIDRKLNSMITEYDSCQ